jgi:DNA-binding MurR/RpiR family transcriptional regulator
MEFIARIKTLKLSKNEKILVDFILSDIQVTAFLTGPQLADECKVSASTVTRFAQKLGFSGYPAFKKELEDYYRKSITPLEIYQQFVKNTKTGNPIQITFEQDMKNLNSMFQQLDPKRINNVAKRIFNARRVIVAAIGSAEACAEMFYQYLEALGINFKLLKGYGISKQIEVLDTITDEDVVIAISFQRILKEVYECAKFAKENGAYTISITDSEFSPLALITDSVLIAPVTTASFSLSQTATIALINILLSEIASIDKEKTLARMKVVKKAWENKPIFVTNSSKE